MKLLDNCQKTPFSITIITLFPDSLQGMMKIGILGKAIQKKILHIHCVQLRDFATNKHKTVDDRPFGGSAGMILRVDVLANCLKKIQSQWDNPAWVIYLSPQGLPLKNDKAYTLAMKIRIQPLILVCGHYEGIDERFIQHFVDEEISIGDYICTGGELPALVLCDTVARFIPGVVGKKENVLTDSFENNLLKYPQYTTPRCFESHTVPEVLLSGNHQKIAQWQNEQRKIQTQKKRPDLLKK